MPPIGADSADSEGAGAAPAHSAPDDAPLVGPTGDPLLAAEFALPALPRTFVRRQRLADRLTSGTSGPLTVISGPAGAGKTTLAASWARLGRTPGPVVWLSLDTGDNAPGVFWAYLLEGFRRTLLIPTGGIGAPACPDSVDRSLLIRLSSALEHLPGPVVLVLDGLEKVTCQEVAADLEFVLAHAGPQLRLVLTSRVDPPLPLHRYRAEDRLCEIRGSDLAFTRCESAELLRGHGVAPAGDTAHALTERTEGWAAGLRLCALVMQQSGDPDGFARSFAASEHAVADYLLAEVLDVQPAATRELLLRTSILDRVHPDLANRLTEHEDAALLLDRLTRANAFVEPIAGTTWCRLHPLFAQVLRAQLRSQQPGLVPRLHHRAARWLADAGQVIESLGHAAAAGDWRFGATEAVQHLMVGRLLADPAADRITRLFSQMPSDVAGAEAALVGGACHLSRRDVEGCRRRLAVAEHHLRRGRTRPTPEVRLTHALLRLLCEPLPCARAGDGPSETPAEEAARQVGELMERLPRWQAKEHPEIEALRRHGLSRALLWSGRLGDARRSFTEAVAACTAGGTHLVRHQSLGLLALTESVGGALTAARDHALCSLAVADEHGVPVAHRCGAAHLALAVVASEREDQRAALHQLDLAMACPDAFDDPVLATELAVVRARQHVARGRWEAALATLTQEGPTRPAWAVERLAVARSAVALARGDPRGAILALRAVGTGGGPEAVIALAFAHLAAGRTDRALRLVAPLERTGDPDPPDHVRIRLLRARAAMLGDDPATAHELLVKALDVARPEQLRRPFAEAGPWLRHLIRNPGGGRCLPAAHTTWLTSRAPDGPGAPVLLEPLSARERDVLACVARMMSTDEIAAELHLSANTIKTHLRNVYRKLCVSRRREAVERGRELRLL